MARKKFKDFVKRDKPRKRPRRHTKRPNKEYQIKKNTTDKADEKSIRHFR